MAKFAVLSLIVCFSFQSVGLAKQDVNCKKAVDQLVERMHEMSRVKGDLRIVAHQLNVYEETLGKKSEEFKSTELQFEADYKKLEAAQFAFGRAAAILESGCNMQWNGRFDADILSNEANQK